MPKRRSYTDVAKCILAAVRELNAVLVEAHEHPQVRVHMFYLDTKAFVNAQVGVIAMQYGCQVTRITKHEIAAKGDGIENWQVAFKMATDASKKSKRGKKAKKSPARKAT